MSAKQPSGLERLETAVERARAELTSLRQANEELRAELRELEAQKQESDSRAGGWEEERSEVQKRLDELAAGLEGLLSEGGGGDPT